MFVGREWCQIDDKEELEDLKGLLRHGKTPYNSFLRDFWYCLHTLLGIVEHKKKAMDPWLWYGSLLLFWGYEIPGWPMAPFRFGAKPGELPVVKPWWASPCFDKFFWKVRQTLCVDMCWLSADLFWSLIVLLQSALKITHKTKRQLGVSGHSHVSFWFWFLRSLAGGMQCLL